MKKLLAFLLAFSLLNVCMAQEDSLAYKPKTYELIGLYTSLKLEFSPESRFNPLLRQNGYPGRYPTQFLNGAWVLNIERGSGLSEVM